jgi:Domain of unknown function (DUF4331)
MRMGYMRKILVLAGLAVALAAPGTRAASHREAPLMTFDPAADITDVYAFVSYDAENLARAPGDRKVTLVMNVNPAEEPSSGPNYFSFDDRVLYALHVDNDRDGQDDVTYEFRFETTIENPDQFLATLALPPVTDLEGANAAGAAVKQRYRIVERRDCKRKGRRSKCRETALFGGAALPAVPSNIGPRTTPEYEQNLGQEGVKSDPATGVRVFAGQRAETFAIDLGAVFDTLNLRRPLPTNSVAEDADDTTNSFGFNSFSGFNVHTIAIEVPASRLTRDGNAPTADTGTIGVYASTSRQALTVRSGAPSRVHPDKLITTRRAFKQVSRMGNPLVNELIIPIGKKDFWNATEPEDEAQFLDAYRNLAVADALNLVFSVPVPAKPREDIVQTLLKYAGQSPDPGTGPFAELLRLDMTVPPTAPDAIKRLGPFAHDAGGNPTPDAAGFPNGRRPNDDVTDIVVRVAGGANYIMNYVSDGVHVSENGITPIFPFLPAPYDGRDRQHRDPGEAL